MIALAQLLALAGALVAFGAVIAVRLLRARLARALEPMPPRVQVLAFEVALALPWIAPLIAMALALAPSLLALAWPAIDHCSAHDDHHVHLCLAHPPAHAAHEGWVLLAIAGALAALAIGGSIAGEIRSHAAARALRDSAAPGTPFWLVPTRRVVCAVAGAIAPVIVVSEGAISRLDPETLRIALAHERAHVVRRDVLRQGLARVLASVHADGAWWVGALAIARERACDERAALEHDRVDVAHALVRFARALEADPPAGVLAFGPLVLEARVRALLEEPAGMPSRARLVAGALVAATAAIVAAPFVHHALETILGVMTH